MGKKAKDNSGKSVRGRRDVAGQVANTLEWLITAFILAFVFRAFIMEAFRIPTGSMADTLLGAHFRLRCNQCGYRYDYGLGNYQFQHEVIPQGPLAVKPTRCPSCGHYQTVGGVMPIANGDRILVLKCIYQFFEPKRWDVVVFKNPLEPQINYIKRLVGLPGEVLEIIDGDIYIDGKIARKPARVQDELWMSVYDNDYRPVRPYEGSFNGHIWQQPFRNVADSKWQVDEAMPAVFSLESPAEQDHTLVYDTKLGNSFRATYAYDDTREYRHMPYCSDLMVRFYAQLKNVQGTIGISLSKYQTGYKARVDLDGNMVIEAVTDRETVELARKPIDAEVLEKPTLVRFANVDHQLVFEIGGEKLIYDLGRLVEDAGPRDKIIEPQLKIFGSGKLELSHVAVFRDVHYLTFDGPGPGRASQGNPFALAKDEFFMLGDNSPNSADSRWWNEPGRGNNNKFYRRGIVPREYLVGKALFVYWPSGYRVFANAPFPVVPNVGRMRFIYGGSAD